MTGSTLAAKLAEARRRHQLIDVLEPSDIPADAPPAYAIQQEMLKGWEARIGAWKIGARARRARHRRAHRRRARSCVASAADLRIILSRSGGT